MTDKEAITPFDSWWDQFGKAILNRHHCAKAARKEGVKEQERRQWQSQTLVAERDKLVAAVTWIAEQEEHICEDCNLREGILSRCKAALLKEETT